MSTTTGPLFTIDEHHHPVSIKCPICGEEMPRPSSRLEAPLDLILWSTEQFLKHEALKHPESSSLNSVTDQQ
jgi:hypothetical protein